MKHKDLSDKIKITLLEKEKQTNIPTGLFSIYLI